MRIVVDDLSGAEVAEFLLAHLTQMRSVSPPESVHALDLDALRAPGITFWTVRADGPGRQVLGCGAVKALDPTHAEVKSMRTDPAVRGTGIASTLLRHVIAHARDTGFARLSLETGAEPFFEPARRLYLKHGFAFCGPFADYTDDPHSVYLTREL